MIGAARIIASGLVFGLLALPTCGVSEESTTPTSTPETTTTTHATEPTTSDPAADAEPTADSDPTTTTAPTTDSDATTTTASTTDSDPTTTTPPTTEGSPDGLAFPGTSMTVADRFWDSTLIWGHDDTEPSPAWRRPPLGAFTVDPAYGTTVRRLTSAEGTRFNRNTYSRRQAENADGTHIFTYHGSAEYRVYEAARGDLVAELDLHADAEPQWHPTDPDRIRHLVGPNSAIGALQLLETTVSDGRTVVIADLTSRVQAQLPAALYMKDRAEGSPSQDGNRYAWIVYDAAEQPIGLVSYDLATDRVLGIRSDLVDDRPDWVGMSVTGRYVVAAHDSGTFVFDADLTNRRLITPALEHSDLALAADGTDRYVFIDFTSNPDTGGWLTSVDLASLDRVTVFDAFDQANTSMHISGKGYDKPGWVVVSTYNCKVPGAWTCEKVMAVELVANGRVLNLAHTYNCGDNYWTETHAVVNRSFSRIYFNSDAGSCGTDAEVYRVEVPAFP